MVQALVEDLGVPGQHLRSDGGLRVVVEGVLLAQVHADLQLTDGVVDQLLVGELLQIVGPVAAPDAHDPQVHRTVADGLQKIAAVLLLQKHP